MPELFFFFLILKYDCKCQGYSCNNSKVEWLYDDVSNVLTHLYNEAFYLFFLFTVIYTVILYFNFCYIYAYKHLGLVQMKVSQKE